ncbi:MAG: hypothetical protein K2X27_19680 [Candidatus Obscuribacterales bacterium]|nr:hypothetical protein [Candidatus Obscuribacterales bacterium]
MIRQIIITLLLLTTVIPTGLGDEEKSSNWFEHNGRKVFLLGANYPWYNGYRGLDFAGLSGNRSISTLAFANGHDLQNPPKEIKPGECGFDAKGIDCQLEDMQSMGIHALRWFIGNDGRSLILFDKEGNCKGIDKAGLENVLTAVRLAGKRKIYISPCIFDFRLVSGDKHLRFSDGKEQISYGPSVKDPRKRKLLIKNFVVPLVTKLAHEKNILYWEIMNEAGNIVSGTDPKTGLSLHGGDRFPENRKVSFEELRAFFNETYDAIKALDKEHPVMPSGLARPYQLPLLLAGVKADLYGAHYNDNGQDFDQIQSVAELKSQMASKYKLKLDKPIIMTEGAATLHNHLDAYLEKAYQGGWAGYFPWQYYKIIGADDFIRSEKVIRAADAGPRASKNIKYWRRFNEEHAADFAL